MNNDEWDDENDVTIMLLAAIITIGIALIIYCYCIVTDDLIGF